MLPETVVAALAPAVAKLSAELPASYRIEVGGTVEESTKSQASVFAVVPLMLFVMISFLMLQLRSFNRLFLVLSVVPMGLIGIVAALLLFGKPLGFVAILGILSLIGMIARNAVILIEQIDYELAQGLGCLECGDRGERVALPPDHADSDIYGTRADPDCDNDILGPDGLSQSWAGLLVATVLTLIFCRHCTSRGSVSRSRIAQPGEGSGARPGVPPRTWP